MNRTLAWLLAILLGLDVVLRLNAPALEEYEVDNFRETFAKLEGYREPDLVFLGSSRADVGFKPPVFAGKTVLGVKVERAYNLGVPHGGALAWMFTRRAVLPAPPPAAIYGTSMFELNEGYKDPGVSLLAPRDYLDYCGLRFGVEQTWTWLVSQTDLALQELWALYRFRQALELLAYDQASRLLPALKANAFDMTRRQKDKKRHGRQIVDGWRSIYFDTNLVELMKQPGFNPRYKNLENFRVGGANRRLFEQTIDALLERGVRTALVHVPVSEPMHAASYTPAMWAEYTGYLSSFARSRGIPFILLSREDYGLTDADYSDVDHLAPEGADKFSRRLAKELRELK